jgi:hypothetical protein
MVSSVKMVQPQQHVCQDVQSKALHRNCRVMLSLCSLAMVKDLTAAVVTGVIVPETLNLYASIKVGNDTFNTQVQSNGSHVDALVKWNEKHELYVTRTPVMMAM